MTEKAGRSEKLVRVGTVRQPAPIGSPLTRKRTRSCRYGGERPQIAAPNETWAMNFMSDTLLRRPTRCFDGRRYRVLTIVDRQP